MIFNFKSNFVQDVFDGSNSRYARKLPLELHNKARRLFDQINVVKTLEELRTPPSNRLEKLQGDLQDFWILRINNQWHIIFRWEDGIAYDVDIVDYH
jgi:proteic killer suppression protein